MINRKELIMNFNLNRSVIIIAIGMAATGCSFSASVGGTIESKTVDLIEGEIAEQFSLGEVSATCNKPADENIGTKFNCASETDIGNVDWVAEITGEEKVFVNSVNLVTKEDVGNFETATVKLFEDRNGTVLGNENLDCGDEPIALDSSNTFMCDLTPPNDEVPYTAEITVTNLETGEFSLNVEAKQ